jgi:hypothetical protein
MDQGKIKEAQAQALKIDLYLLHFLIYTMTLERSYDVSCIRSSAERQMIQHAIDGVNLACRDGSDAWKYVSEGRLVYDVNRRVGDHETLPKTILDCMRQDGHSGSSISFTVQTLVEISRDYDSWKRMREEYNARSEEADKFWIAWRHTTLNPYLRSVSGGGTVLSLAPLLNDFLELKQLRNDTNNETLSNLTQELFGYLGSTEEEQLERLERIIEVHDVPNVLVYYNTLKNKLAKYNAHLAFEKNLIQENLKHLDAAILSKNPVALYSALNPGWSSAATTTSEQFKLASKILDGLT